MIKKAITIIISFFLLSCQEQKKEEKAENKEYSNNINRALPALFDKKYFHGYQLSPDSDYPIYSHTDKNVGELTISFINKDIDKQKEWLQFDFNNNLEPGDDPDDKYFDNLNKVIKTKLEPNLNTYEIIAEHIPAKYLESKTLDYIYPYTKTYYLYNKEKKSWDFIKEKIISDGANEKNITKLTELNAMITISSTKNALLNKDSLKQIKDTTLFVNSSQGESVKLLINTKTNDSIFESEIFGETGKSTYKFVFNKFLKKAECTTYRYTEPISVNSNPKIKSEKKENLLSSKVSSTRLTNIFNSYLKAFIHANISNGK
ncbi:hypothetical protein N6B72_15235 [Chryseobacterium soli]|uniref:Lipoprotein n=1 Tax=Chryseobacterium soli TaxID=445961 RepID=A0A086A8Q3_9FLAO|nr:hypothetical protein [Chryseobacterium soli]KFF13067.1 hypothetical protein IW15_09890 [Chryseobacterium soli]MDV7698277.1 hypothetical protein [Chryseobacterium soli]